MEREQWISRVQQALDTMLTIDEKMEAVSARQQELEDFHKEVEKRKGEVYANGGCVLLLAALLSVVLIVIKAVTAPDIIWLILLFADFGLIYKALHFLEKRNENSEAMHRVLEQAMQEEAVYQAAIEASKVELADYIASADVDELQKTIPEDYATMDAVLYFLSVLKNMRADNLKEAINLYEEELHKRKMLNYQQQEMDLLVTSIQLSQAQLETQAQIAKSQADIQKRAEKLSKQVRFGNVFQVVNTVRHWNS